MGVNAVASSGDLAADRRFLYAQDLLQDGDVPAAIDLLRQTLQLVPRWPPAWFALGEAHAQAAQPEDAITAFRRTLELAPEDTLGAGLHLARLGAGEARMTAAYVAALFDQYAHRFDEHLVGALNYRGPQIIVAALAETCAALGRSRHFRAAMDLGCGTGLMARAIRSHVDAIDGVDLSPEMVKRAAATRLYRSVRAADAVEALRPASPLGEAVMRSMTDEGESRRGGSPSSDRRLCKSHPLPPEKEGTIQYSLILAADVMVYINDLNPLLQAAAQALEPQGLFAFTVQSGPAGGPTLGADLRYSHGDACIRDAAAAAGLALRHSAPCVTRQDRGIDVPGRVVVLARRDD